LITAVVHYTAAAVTDRGRKRPSNEDAFGYSVEHGVYVVCDGMGGAAAGEIASSLAVDEVLSLFESALPAASEDPCKAQVERALQAVSAANHAIYTRSRRNYRLNGMGTTLVMLASEENRICVVNVGDSRCYRLRHHQFEQITQDHSLVEEQIRAGRMTRAEALRSPLRNVITRALGTQNQVTADIFALEAEPGDLFLLCSDGLTREISDATIQALLVPEEPLEAQGARLVEAAKKAGGHDNITCLLVRVEAIDPARLDCEAASQIGHIAFWTEQ
jgi:protein phosphatase